MVNGIVVHNSIPFVVLPQKFRTQYLDRYAMELAQTTNTANAHKNPVGTPIVFTRARIYYTPTNQHSALALDFPCLHIVFGRAVVGLCRWAFSALVDRVTNTTPRIFWLLLLLLVIGLFCNWQIRMWFISYATCLRINRLPWLSSCNRILHISTCEKHTNKFSLSLL